MPKMPKFWNTEHEMQFIDGLGTYKLDGQPMRRVKLLRIYYKAAKRRSRWDHVDQEAVLKRVRGELGWEKK